MSLAFFPCCVASDFVDHAQVAARLVVDKLGVEIEDGAEFNCCGYPYKGIDFKAFILLSGRNLALAEKNGADLVTTCGCCYVQPSKPRAFSNMIFHCSIMSTTL